MKCMLPLVAVLALAALPRGEAAVDADPFQIVVSPDLYVGKAVTVAVKFTKIELTTAPWEEQANLTASSKIKFTAAPLGDIKCYADRSQRNREALSGLRKGKKLVLTGSVRRYRLGVKTTYQQKWSRARSEEVEREEKGRIRTRYAFIVETIALAE